MGGTGERAFCDNCPKRVKTRELNLRPCARSPASHIRNHALRPRLLHVRLCRSQPAAQAPRAVQRRADSGLRGAQHLSHGRRTSRAGDCDREGFGRGDAALVPQAQGRPRPATAALISRSCWADGAGRLSLHAEALPPSPARSHRLRQGAQRACGVSMHCWGWSRAPRQRRRRCS